MDKNDEKRRQLVGELMVCGAASSPSSGPDKLLQPWRLIARHLSPLIGESGFCALYGRAARLALPAHGWLGASPSFKTIDSVIAFLGERFGQAAAQQAQDANLVLLDTFLQLLAGLIGETLTMRLLHSAVQEQVEQKNAQEQK